MIGGNHLTFVFAADIEIHHDERNCSTKGRRCSRVSRAADVNFAGAFADLRPKLAPTSSIRTQ
jgi:hypothetical protein